MTFAYDKTGNLTAQNTGENQSIENSYNEIGQVTTVKNSEGTITYQYNQQGYLVSVTNVNGSPASLNPGRLRAALYRVPFSP